MSGAIVSLILCPHPPLLLRELGGLADPVAELREACRAVLVEALAESPDRVVVVGGADTAGSWDDEPGFDVRRWGTTVARTGSATPLSVGVGRRLLDEAGWTGPTELLTVGWDGGADELEALRARLAGRDERTVLLLLGEGSARRGQAAPGFLDERAFGFDDALASAIADGDAGALRGLDAELARELMAEGRAALRLMGALAGDGPASAELRYRDDPFGTSYFVARWDLRPDPA